MALVRRLLAWVPAEHERRLVEAARRHGGHETVLLDGRALGNGDGETSPAAVLLTHLPNDAVGAFVEDLQEIEELRVSLVPQGAIPIGPPVEEVPPAADLTLRSPLEIFLAGLQSLGSWKGFISYAAVSGCVVWVGFFTNTIYLLVAGMLISPLGGPAMNSAIATARGDLRELGRSVARYGVALAIGAAAAAALTVAFGLTIATELMVDVSSVSIAAVVVPLVAGAAGAINLVQSERSSLVSGAATGMLIAAALAPPMGIIGMALVLGELDLVKSAAFLLGLQLVGINVAGSVVFRLAGVSPSGPRYPHGRGGVRTAVSAAALVALGGFLAWQFLTAPALQRETFAREAETIARRVLDQSGQAAPLEVRARYTRADVPGPNTVLVEIYAQAAAGTEATDELAESLRREVSGELEAALADSTPVVHLVLLRAP